STPSDHLHRSELLLPPEPPLRRRCSILDPGSRRKSRDGNRSPAIPLIVGPSEPGGDTAEAEGGGREAHALPGRGARDHALRARRSGKERLRSGQMAGVLGAFVAIECCAATPARHNRARRSVPPPAARANRPMSALSSDLRLCYDGAISY